MTGHILARGAEAVLVHDGKKVVKQRIAKGYRYPALDAQIRKKRTRSEAKLLKKSSEIIASPKLLAADESKKEIVMEFIAGKTLSESLDAMSLQRALSLCREIGASIALLHAAGIIHGDLTTSNMILSKGKVFFIDFGLGFHSAKVEDMAVDLHLLRQAFESKHFIHWQSYFKAAREGYAAHSRNSVKVMDRFDKVEGRGRYKGKKRDNY